MKIEQARAMMSETIESILTDSPDPAVYCVLKRRFQTTLESEITDPVENKWHGLLSSAQEVNGNWRRFHVNLKHIPLREAVNKATIIGLDTESSLSVKALSFATSSLRLSSHDLENHLLVPEDPCRKWVTPAICLAVLTNVASRLRASKTTIMSAFGQLIEVVQEAYQTGEYNRDAEHALLENRELVLHWGAYQKVWQAARDPIIVELMGIHESELTTNFRERYFRDLWHNLRFYDNYPSVSSGAPDPSANATAAWFMNHHILSLFPEWKAAAHDHVDYLWIRRDEKGLWDFGAPSDTSGFASRLQVSSKWTATARKHDWSLHALALFGRYYGEDVDWPTMVSSRRPKGCG